MTALELPQYAAVQAGLAAGLALEIALAEQGITPASWRAESGSWERKLRDDFEQGGSLSDRYETLYDDAYADLGPRIEPLDDELEAWVAFSVRLTSHPRPVSFLSRLGLSRADADRLTRRWEGKLEADPELRARFDELAAGPQLPLPTVTKQARRADRLTAPKTQATPQLRSAAAPAEAPREGMGAPTPQLPSYLQGDARADAGESPPVAAAAAAAPAVSVAAASSGPGRLVQTAPSAVSNKLMQTAPSVGANQPAMPFRPRAEGDARADLGPSERKEVGRMEATASSSGDGAEAGGGTGAGVGTGTAFVPGESGASTATPFERDAVTKDASGLSLIEYAEMCAKLELAGRQRASTLQAEGWTSEQWSAIDDHWQAQIAASERLTMDWMRRVAMSKAKLKRQAEESSASEAAGPAPPAPEPSWTVKQYAALCVELASGKEPDVLRQFHLTPAAAEKLHAEFRGRLGESAELRQQWNEARRVYAEWKRGAGNN